ncbi:MAG: extracellular solute-binding protein [Clostridia bacterium]
MKKRISLLLATIMIFMTFIGFGMSVNADTRTVIKWAAQTDNTPATKTLVDEFNRTQTKYRVEWVQMTNDSTQMKTQLLTSLSAKSSEYDVINLDVVWAGEFSAAGYLSPIDKDMYYADLKKNQFNSGSMAAGTYMGKQYTLPFFPDLGVLYFRSDIVSKEDVAKLISGKYTHKDLAAMAKKYKGKGGTTDGIVYQARQYEGLTCNVAEFTGGFTDIKGGLETMKSFTTSGIAPKNILNYNEAETHNSFINGKSVFARNWPYQYSMLTQSVKPAQVGIAPLPKGSTVGGWLLSINKYSNNREGAFEFMKFAAGWTGQMIMSRKGGYLPGYNVLLNDQRVLDVNPMLKLEGFKNAVKTTISRPVSSQYSKTSDAIQVNVHKYLSGGQDLNTTVKAVQNAMK